ncbi:hypothetical protein BP6252_07657 [Coleophoma cylindrospora]|uniref:Uncharacterized protein n=1 Tax=Coleophoma cylindrospora TaxID=1849047 RepID=A0A3D8RB52_9HELO|nr:hypothetical protein BP6252_07657 [Coleophoma cylindrospora]
MSSDLLAEFDSFYQAPSQNNRSAATPSTNDLAFLDGSISTTSGQTWQSNQQSAQWQSNAPPAQTDIWGDMTSFSAQAAIPQQPSSQNDIWGSFGAAADNPKPLPGLPVAQGQGNYTQPFGDAFSQITPGIQRKSTIELFNAATEHGFTPTTVVNAKKSPPPTSSSGAEVLFDADEEQDADDDDDFGDFETVTSPAPTAPQQLDLLFDPVPVQTKPSVKRAPKPMDVLVPSPNSLTSPLPYPQAPKSPSYKERTPFADLKVAPVVPASSQDTAASKPASAAPITAWPSYEAKESKYSPFADSPAPAPAPASGIDEAWGDFADLPAETPTAAATSTIEEHAWGWDWNDRVPHARSPPKHSKASNPLPAQKASSSAKTSRPTPAPEVQKVVTVPRSTVPPTNIPPPSVLLTLFPALFNLPQTALFKPVSDQPFSLKNRIMSDPSTVKFLRGYLLIAVVAARIIAGRKLRWKRDTLLSQAMKIGPAAAGGKGGMKLSGVDKAETKREDREAADVVRLWKEQLGRLKSAVAAANSSNHDILSHLVIPEISDVMHVNTLKGAMTDVKPCVLCGLKREERVAKVDIDELIEDSFGEYWIGHWGHRDCRNFWDEHEKTLKQR